MIGVPIGRILGIEVRLQVAWVLVIALVAALASVQVGQVAPNLGMALQWAIGAVVAAGFFLSAIAHDLSHAILARRRGVEVKSIVISFFGGATPLDPASPIASNELAIALVGPATSLGLGGALAIAATAFGTSTGQEALVIAQILAVLAVLNLILGLVNVIPAYPLDGGRIVRAFVWRRSGSERRGWAAAGTSGRIVGTTIIGIGAAVILMGQLTNGAMVALSGWFLLLSARAIRDRLRIEELIGGLTVGEVMDTDVPSVHPGLTVDTFASQLLDGESQTTAIPVLRDDEVVGLLGVRQIRRLRPGDWATTRVEQVMATPPRLPFLSPDEDLAKSIEQLQRAGLDGLPVVEAGRLVGVLTRRSIGRAVHSRQGGPTEPAS